MSPAGPLKVLSVEDNPETRILLRHLLEDTCDITLATDIEEAHGALEQEEFDLLLLDIHLGLKNERGGVDLLHRIRDSEELGTIPAVAVTAYAMPGDRQDLLQEGFDEYVGKPFTGADLQSTIDRVLS